MQDYATVEDFIRLTYVAASIKEVEVALTSVCDRLGFRFFALTHHVDFKRQPHPAIRIHNYPESWADFFDENRLGIHDPIHRASHTTNVGFPWSSVPSMIPMTQRDREILVRAEREGIGEGFTVPAHVPGEFYGSCSFATAPGRPIHENHLPLVQLIGSFAFEGARRLSRVRDLPVTDQPVLTERQRECVILVAQGKTDWEISRILGVSHETVIQHLKQARERYGVTKRTLLAIRALFDASISFSDVFRR